MLTAAHLARLCSFLLFALQRMIVLFMPFTWTTAGYAGIFCVLAVHIFDLRLNG